MEFKITEKEMQFENEQYASRMIITAKGTGYDKDELRLRCAVKITIRIKGTDNELKLRGNIYWDVTNPETNIFFTGGSMVNFVGEQSLDYKQFKSDYWDMVKRLAANAFTKEEIRNYTKMRAQETA